jgi:hypothetical protein
LMFISIQIGHQSGDHMDSENSNVGKWIEA